MNRSRFLRLGLALAASLLVQAASPAAAQSAKSADAAKVLRIGFQKGSVNLSVLKQRGALEKRFKDYAVSWIEFPAGPQLLEALSVGGVDFGAVGDTPPIFAQAAGKDLVYVGAEPPKPDSSAILVPKASKLRSLADLRGKRIAFQKGSSAHFLTVRALEKAGLAYTEIEPAHLAPAEARAAFERGSVDAWAIWDPYYAAAEGQGGTRVLTTGRGLVGNNTFYLASRAFAEASPALIGLLFEELNINEAFLHQRRNEAVALYSSFSGLDAVTVNSVLDRRPRGTIGRISQALVEDQQRVADAFLRLGLIPRSIKVAEIVWHAESTRLSRN